MAGKAVLGISAVCCTSVMAARQKTGVEQMSSMSIVESIGSLLSQDDQTSRAFALIQQEMAKTPGVESDYDGALRDAITKLENDVETKIVKAQEDAQDLLDAAYAKYEAAASNLRETKEAADAIDKSFYECIETEQDKLKATVAAQQTLATATAERDEACKLMNDNDDFSFASDAEYKFNCDVGTEGDCAKELADLEKKVSDMEKQAQSSLSESQEKYRQMREDCNSKIAAQEAAQKALTEARQAFGLQQRECNGIKQARFPAICKAGEAMQVKCGEESKFTQLLETHRPEEADRIKEWESTSTMKCLLGKYADGEMGEVASSDDLQACSNGELGFDRLNLRSDTFRATQQCQGGAVKFFNGDTWKVYKGRYTKESFAPTITLAAGAKPFPFCGGAAVGEQNVNGGGNGPLAPPEAQFEDGAVLHEIGETQCDGVTWATVPTKKAGAIDDKLVMGSTLATWGCDRLKKANNFGQLIVNSKAYAVVSCGM